LLLVVPKEKKNKINKNINLSRSSPKIIVPERRNCPGAKESTTIK
jgi:hypothetical protein